MHKQIQQNVKSTYKKLSYLYTLSMHNLKLKSENNSAYNSIKKEYNTYKYH